MYYNGYGVKQDYFEAVNWYQSGGAGYAQAQLNLGVMYYKGQGVKQDFLVAKKHFGDTCDNKLQSGCEKHRILNEQGY